MEAEPDPKLRFNTAVRADLALILCSDGHWSDPDLRFLPMLEEEKN